MNKSFSVGDKVNVYGEGADVFTIKEIKKDGTVIFFDGDAEHIDKLHTNLINPD